jgi:hypothetical protein
MNSSLNEETGLYEVRGLAWGQAGSISAVEGRLGDGSWMQAAYEVVDGGLGALERFEWVMAFDLGKLEKGQHVLEVRGLNEEGAPSLPVFASLQGTGAEMDGSEGLTGDLLTMVILVVLLALVLIALVGGRIDPPLHLHQAEDEGKNTELVVDAVLVDEDGQESQNAPIES